MNWNGTAFIIFKILNKTDVIRTAFSVNFQHHKLYMQKDCGKVEKQKQSSKID